MRDGRFPTADDEIAITSRVADMFDVGIGDSFALDGVARTVVGLVENPSDLSDRFALLSPSIIGSSESVTVFVDATDEVVDSFRPPGTNSRITASRGDIDEGMLAAIGVLVVATIALFLVSLVAAAGFIAIAQRRLRQLGMLSAVGATEKHLRLVMIANGMAVGGVAAVLGAMLGVTGWVALAPRIETAVDYRIDALNVPWWLVVAGMVLAVLTATCAAWWPARTVARIPTVRALSGRPPRPAPVHRSAALALVFIIAGVACLVLVGSAGEGSVNWTTAVLIAAGALATVIGVLLASPLAVRALSRSAARSPIAVRLALRDLGRFQARSGAALAAISLVLGIPVTTVVIAASATNGVAAGNLSDHQLLVRAAEVDGPFIPEAADVDGLQAGIAEILAALADATAIELDVAVAPDAPRGDPGFYGRPAPTINARAEEGWVHLSLLYVARPELLAKYGVGLDAFPTDSDFLTVETGELEVLGGPRPGGGRPEVETVTNPGSLHPTYSSLPGSFITPEGLQRRGWESAPSGRWLIESDQALDGDELATAREIEARTGLTIESRDRQGGLATLRSSATAAGMLLALAVLAMTVGLIRSEAAGDVRILTATGATSTARRTLTATTAAALALLGALLGTIGAYLALAAAHIRDLGDLTPIPVGNLAVIVLGTPVAAAIAGWLLAGREPPGYSRQPIA